MAKWKVPTLQDHRSNIRAAQAQGRRPSFAGPPTTHFDDVDDFNGVCRCGKVTGQHLFVDVRGLPADVRAQAKIPDDATFLCDGCVDYIFGNGFITHYDFFSALGANNDPKAMQSLKEYSKRYIYPRGSVAYEKRNADKLFD